MVRNEIYIGREVGKDDYQIDKQYTSVGRKHARIVRKPDGIYIEDLHSVNGTFVNGKSIYLKKISASDIITLGRAGSCVLNLEDILKRLPVSDRELHDRFLQLKQIYDDYIFENNRLQTKGTEVMMTKRLLPTMLSGTFTGIITLLFGYNLYMKLLIAVLGTIFTVVVFFVATKMVSKSAQAMRVRLNCLSEDFELNYVCPACGTSFKGRSWEFLNKTGKCPACKRSFHADS